MTPRHPLSALGQLDGGVAAAAREAMCYPAAGTAGGDMFQRILLLALGMLATACSASTTERSRLPPLTTVARVDLRRYAGTWYEIASFPTSFQRDCTGTTATYTLRADGRLGVVNRCRKRTLGGPENTSQGQARVVDRSTNAKLEVSFFWPLWGDYWIIVLDAQYQYAAVGHPSRDYLWILSRTPQLPDAVYTGIVAQIRALGYDATRLRRTLQPAEPPI